MKKYIFLISILIFIIPMIIYANGGKPIEDPIDQTIIFDENSGISLLEETINYRFGDNLYEAKVEVGYNLKNTTNQVQSFNIMFITPHLQDADFKVMIDNGEINDVKIQKDIKLPKNWRTSMEKHIIEPISKEILTKSYTVMNGRSFTGATFPVTIRPNDSIKLYITYNSESGFYRYQKTVNTVYSQLYYLTPAKFWEGDAKVNLRVEFPKDSNIEMYSNIPMNKINNYTYEGTVDKIPDEEWLFSFTKKDGLIFNTNYKRQHNIIVISIIILLFIVIRIVKLKFNKKYITFLLYLLIVFLVLNISAGPYGILYIPFIIFYGILNHPLFYLLIIVIIGIKVAQVYKSKNRF